MIWIRSQDKTRLLKVNFVRKNWNSIETINSDGSCTLIGKYSTEEKALKVVDMIEKHIESENWDKVFQMPQDSEV